MIRFLTIAASVGLALALESAGAETAPAKPSQAGVEIRSVTVGGKALPLRPGEGVRLPAFPENVAFGYGATGKSNPAPTRLRYKLEGYDHQWHESWGQMFLAIRFLDQAGEQVARKTWNVSGESPGWNGELASAPLNHRRETVVVPPGTARFQVSISSGGPAGTVGIYVVDGLVVSKLSGAANTVVLRSPVGQRPPERSDGEVGPDWVRNGTRPSMAKVVEIGRNPATKALAIVDEDPFGHADWDSPRGSAPRVSPGEQLLLEWNEVYSMGMATDWYAMYSKLPEGSFRFCVAELTALGQPTGAQVSLGVRVPLPFWRTVWFWGAIAILLVGLSAAAGRYLTWRRVRAGILRLRQERALEQERLRIAQDIHDDLGARITQISLLSGMSQNDPQVPEKARATFDTISRMSRDLVCALYETVWTVNPENDNLEALGSYLCQMVNQLCQPTQLPCRLHLGELPAGVRVSSHTRHHLTLAVKEAVHNVIKHAQALEQLPARCPDVVLMDIKLPGMSGIDCVARLKQLMPGLQIVMVTVYEDSQRIFRALKAGASGYLLKSSPPQQLLEAVRDVHGGGAPMSSHIARQVVRHFHSAGAVPEQKPLLSPRERQVLELLSTGCIYKEIADQLDIGVETVRTHVKSICQKMHARNRLEAVARHHANLE